MGIIGDFVVWSRDGSTKTVRRYGDYLTTRRCGMHRGRSSLVTSGVNLHRAPSPVP
jgi:hypothetical protein